MIQCDVNSGLIFQRQFYLLFLSNFNSGPSSIGIGNGGLALNAAAGAGGLAGDLAAKILGTNTVGGAVGGLSSNCYPKNHLLIIN